MYIAHYMGYLPPLLKTLLELLTVLEIIPGSTLYSKKRSIF